MVSCLFVLQKGVLTCSMMEVALKIACSAFLVLGSVQTAVLPEEKCTLTDSACMLPAFQKMLPTFVAGIPERNVESMDPLKLPDKKYDLAGFQFTLNDGTLKGLKNAVIESVDWDTDKERFSFTFHTDATLKGHYIADGRILVLPISGDGQIKLKLKNLQVKMVIYYELVKDGDNEYIKPIKRTSEFAVKDNAHFNLTNLFNGNKELSEPMLVFLNENWRQISVEFGTPLVNTAGDVIYNNIINYLHKLPISEITKV